MTAAFRASLVAVLVLAGAVNVALVLAGATDVARAQRATPPANIRSDRNDRNDTITAVPGITVGHVTLTERPTGCTVVLAPAGGAMGAVAVRGGSPGTRETDALAAENSVLQVHAIALAGGSAFGLDTAGGVMRFLAERRVGFATSAGPVPIVPAAILYDLQVGDRPEIRPAATCGYDAARTATSAPAIEGSVGAGAGATIGKLLGHDRAMKGGIGSAALRTGSGLIVGALVVVNALGSVVDPRTGRVVAGVRSADGRGLEDPFLLVRRGIAPTLLPRQNTTLGVVATNARLTRAEAIRVAEMAHDGLARAIVPAHTPGDGDTIFVLATGTLASPVNVGAAGALAAETITDAILRAVRAASGLPRYPSVANLR
jgi:L-aminopeptidase/D-esterase-like protein